MLVSAAPPDPGFAEDMEAVLGEVGPSPDNPRAPSWTRPFSSSWSTASVACPQRRRWTRSASTWKSRSAHRRGADRCHHGVGLLHDVHRAAPEHRARREAFVEGVLAAFPPFAFDLLAARAHARLWAELALAGNRRGGARPACRGHRHHRWMACWNSQHAALRPHPWLGRCGHQPDGLTPDRLSTYGALQGRAARARKKCHRRTLANWRRHPFITRWETFGRRSCCGKSLNRSQRNSTGASVLRRCRRALASAIGGRCSGRRGRRFKSGHPDSKVQVGGSAIREDAGPLIV
jgi:hypothetical protein